MNKEIKSKKIEIVSTEPLKEGNFIKTSSVKAKREDGKDIVWEMIDFRDTVHVLVENVDRGTVVLCSQPRIPVLVKNPETNGDCIECCAGVIDKDCSTEQHAVEEVLEELGYQIEVKDLEPIRHYLSSLGTAGDNCYAFFVKVTDKQKVSEGGGLPEEDITPVEFTPDEVIKLIESTDKFIDSTTLFMLTYWALIQVAGKQARKE